MDLLCFFSVLCLLCLCEHLFICALCSPAGKGLTCWLSFVVSNCEFVTIPLVYNMVSMVKNYVQFMIGSRIFSSPEPSAHGELL